MQVQFRSGFQNQNKLNFKGSVAVDTGDEPKAESLRLFAETPSDKGTIALHDSLKPLLGDTVQLLKAYRTCVGQKNTVLMLTDEGESHATEFRSLVEQDKENRRLLGGYFDKKRLKKLEKALPKEVLTKAKRAYNEKHKKLIANNKARTKALIKDPSLIAIAALERPEYVDTYPDVLNRFAKSHFTQLFVSAKDELYKRASAVVETVSPKQIPTLIARLVSK